MAASGFEPSGRDKMMREDSPIPLRFASVKTSIR
jgi:hypothetical protein